MKVRFVSPANIELDEAVRYYDHQLPGLGFSFYQEVDAAIERIRGCRMGSDLSNHLI